MDVTDGNGLDLFTVTFMATNSADNLAYSEAGRAQY